MSPWYAKALVLLASVPFVAGIVCLALGLWIFRRSHADLGTNWSITLEVREKAYDAYVARTRRLLPGVW